MCGVGSKTVKKGSYTCLCVGGEEVWWEGEIGEGGGG
jgi:hypothetical protein